MRCDLSIRRSRFAWGRPALPLAVLGLWAASAWTAAAVEPVRLAPESAVVYVELSRPEALLDHALAPSTKALVQELEPYKQYAASPQYAHVQLVTTLLEGRLGVGWEAALRDIVGGGIYFAADPAGETALLIVRARRPELVVKLNDALIEFIETDAKNNSRPSPVQTQEHNGVRGWTFGPNECHVILDDLLLVSNKPDTLKAAIDRAQGGGKSLADVAEFQQARGQAPAGTVGWAWAKLGAVLQVLDVAKALENRSNNILAELLLGGVLDTLRRASFATLSLNVDGAQARLRAEMPRDQAQTDAKRLWFFAGEQATGGAVLKLPGTIAAFTMLRDLSGLWQSRDELFDEKTVAGLTQADSQLGLFFSGRDFGPEVLGELDPAVQLVAARQEYAADQPMPALKLPAFALVLKMKHPDDFSMQLLQAFQNIIGIANIGAGQQGQPQLLLSTEDYHGATLTKATYPTSAKTPKEKAPVNYNFSPACVRVGGHFVFASTLAIARQLVDALSQTDAAAAAGDNTLLALESAPLAAILDDNRELLISQNMLSEGHTRPEAEIAIDTLLKLVRLVRDARLRLAAEPNALALEISAEINASKP